MTISSTIGFAAAWTKGEGDWVAYAGTARQIVAVSRHGKDSPYYLLADCGWVSWQYCGDCR